MERRDYDLVCLSPVHIGSGEVLRAYQYLYDPAQSMVYFLDERKWIAYLAQKGWLDDFADYVADAAQKRNQRQGVWDWLKRQGASAVEMRKLALRSAKATTKSTKSSLNDIHVQISQADGMPYIPGSSIKGAMRTAILYALVKKNPQEYRDFWQQLQHGRARDKERVMQELEIHAFHRLNRRDTKPRDMVNSVMQGLRVSDATTRQRETVLCQKVDVTTQANRRTGETRKTLPLFRECLPKGRQLHFSVVADFSMLEKIGITSFADILEDMREFLLDGLALEEKAFASTDRGFFKEAREGDFLLGGGTGFLTKTIVQALAPDARAARDFTANLLDEKFTVKNRLTRRMM